MSLGKEMKDKWIKALESGKYKQTSVSLKSDEGHCCLGVLCEIHPDLDPEKGQSSYDKLDDLLGSDIAEKLWKANDRTFKPEKPDYSNVIPLIKEIVK